MGDQVHDRSLLGEFYMYIFSNWVTKVIIGYAKLGKFGSGEDRSLSLYRTS